LSTFRRFARSLVLVLGLVPATALADQPGIVVNGQPLSMQEVLDYGVDVPPGRYWYDQVSGLWGAEGGPSVGQITPGLPLGGTLEVDASSGSTGVFINGREIHMLELLELQQLFGEVPLGRYWLGADGVGGLEGGPATFSLAPAPSQADSGGSGGYFEDNVADFFIRNGQSVPDMPGPVYE
jgi:hypothetical protein